METDGGLITFSPPCASMSGEHLRIRLLQPIGARLRADGRRGRPIGAQRQPSEPTPTYPPPPHPTSQPPRSRDRTNQREVFKKDGNVSQACTRKCYRECRALLCANVRKIEVRGYFIGRVYYYIICMQLTGKRRSSGGISNKRSSPVGEKTKSADFSSN